MKFRLLVICLLCSAAPAMAQRETFTNLNGWLAWFNDVELPHGWFVDSDLNARRSGPYDEVQQYLWRVSLRRNLMPNVRVAVGYAGSDTHPYGDLPIALRTPEHRLFEHLQLLHATGRTQWTHRYRLEQRWGGRMALEDGEPQVQNWIRTNRFRYLVRATVPLQGTTLDVNEWFVTVGDELFMNWGANVQQNVFDQNRLMGSVGRRLGSRMRLEVGYTEQLIERPNGRQLERNHTLTTTLTTSFARGR
ncbi:MAG: DUF2490 domain-containing protein [Gemmatimonadetes bacterium]|nr:DUF2490 domain-containing protein [Gemmatimonadota bacterium]